MHLFVCPCVCPSVFHEHISGTVGCGCLPTACLHEAGPIRTKFSGRGSVFLGGVALLYVLPVLWMTSRLAVMGARPARLAALSFGDQIRERPGPESDVYECLFRNILNTDSCLHCILAFLHLSQSLYSHTALLFFHTIWFSTKKSCELHVFRPDRPMKYLERQLVHLHPTEPTNIFKLDIFTYLSNLVENQRSISTLSGSIDLTGRKPTFDQKKVVSRFAGGFRPVENFSTGFSTS